MNQTMNEVEYIKTLESRISNLEAAFLALFAITKDTLPPAYAHDADRLVEEFFYSQASFHVDGVMPSKFKRRDS